MTVPTRTLLLIVPLEGAAEWERHFKSAAPEAMVRMQDRDAYASEEIDYVAGFRPAPGLLATLPNLRAAFTLGAGVDGFLRDPDYPRSVPLVRFVSEALSREMVQYVVLQVLTQHRDVARLARQQTQRQWLTFPHARPTPETRIGILGMGEIGQRAAMVLRELGFAIAGWSNTRKQMSGVESFVGDTELGAFLSRTDVLICLLPLTPQTRGILNTTTFAQLPRGAYVINAARGGHLVERDLLAALDSGYLSGATLDVFETEPLPQGSPLWSHPKITVTPHNAGLTDPAEAAAYVAKNIARFERDEELENIVDLKRGY